MFPTARADARPWTDSTPWIERGNRMVLGLGAGFVLLAIVLSINSAVVAPGAVGVESQYKTVQHLDGGIVGRILVRNGDAVKAGDPLLVLDDTVARASLQVTMGRLQDLWIQQARLEAERDRSEGFAPPPALAASAADPEIARILSAQRALFAARKAARDGERQVLTERHTQVAAELAGLVALHVARQREKALIGSEVEAVRPLFKKGLVNQQRMNALERDAARLDGELARLDGDIARARAALAENDLKIAQTEKAFTEAVVDELRKVQAAIAELEENRKAQADRLQRTTVRAPASGRVHALAAHTEGGVISPGTPILQVIPDGERLVVMAQVEPRQIDRVRQGLTAFVRFPAVAAATTPRLEGRVAMVSAAELTSAQGRVYFEAKIIVETAELAKLGAGKVLVPGMPAEVYIDTGSRSIMSYLLKPLIDAIYPAMREA